MSALRFPSRHALAALLAGALAGAAAQAQTADAVPQISAPIPVPAPAPAAPTSAPRMTWDLQASHSELSAGLPDGHAVNLRGAVTLAGGDVLLLDLLGERKFGATGGVAAAAYTAVLSPDWYVAQTLAAGHGGPNWANFRTDTQLSRKWLSQRQLVSSVAFYRAWFDNDRSDTGLRLSMAWYLDLPAVLEAGVIVNVSQPGSVNSRMPYASVTVGREGQQYLSLRVSSGSEAYQAIGSQAQLVDFHSSSVALGWRRWIGPQWGLTAQAERYRNPSYQRHTLGLGLFVQF